MADSSNPDRHEGPSAAAVDVVQLRIREFRGQRVLLDADLAEMYGVETRVLVQAVGRNPERFPPDFMFRLDDREFADLKSQSVIASGWGGRRTRPYAFTEQGVAMLSGVLRSPQAVAVNVTIMRAFVHMRQTLATHAELARRVDDLERGLAEHDAKHDSQIAQIVEALRQLSQPPPVKRRGIGFAPQPDDE